MTPRNAILFFMIFAVIVGGGIWIFVAGNKNDSPQNFAENLPPAQDPNAKAKSTGSFFSNFFSMPSFENLAPNFPSTFPPTGSQPATPTENASPEINSSFSPLKDKIHLNRNYEYLTLRIDSTVKEKIRITGLTLKSAASGAVAQIGQGTYLYLPNANPQQDIYATGNDVLYIITGRSPLGVSFHINKCMGYFNQNQSFNPYLSTNCPLIKNEPLPKAPNNLNDQCLDYIDQFSACRTFTKGLLELSPECNNFLIEKTNYNYCQLNHKNDKDFFAADWRIYLARDETLWKSKREIIELLDQNGKLIDSVSY